MIQVNSNVSRFDAGDYVAIVNFNGHRTIWGFSRNSRFLLDAVVSHCRRLLPKGSSFEVIISIRTSLSSGDVVPVAKSFSVD